MRPALRWLQLLLVNNQSSRPNELIIKNSMFLQKFTVGIKQGRSKQVNIYYATVYRKVYLDINKYQMR